MSLSVRSSMIDQQRALKKRPGSCLCPVSHALLSGCSGEEALGGPLPTSGQDSFKESVAPGSVPSEL